MPGACAIHVQNAFNMSEWPALSGLHPSTPVQCTVYLLVSYMDIEITLLHGVSQR